MSLSAPPKATKMPHDTGRGYNDPYHWMRDAKVQAEGIESNPDICDHIVKEYQYSQAILKPLAPLVSKLHGEMLSMMLASEYSEKTYRETAEYLYYYRINPDKCYPTYYYKSKTTGEARELVALDVNKLVNESGIAPNVSENIYLNPQHSKVAYHMNDVGDVYTIKVLDLATNTYSDEIPNTLNDNIVWKKDGSGFFYTPRNPDTLGTDFVKYHKLGDDVQYDITVVENRDPTISVTIENHSEKYLFVAALSSSERDLDGISRK